MLRVLRPVLAVLLAASVLLGGVLLAVEAFLLAADRPAWLLPRSEVGDQLRRTSWDDPGIITSLALLLVVALLLVLVALAPARRDVTLASTTSGLEINATRRGVARSLERSVRRLPGVSGAEAKVGRRSTSLQVTSGLREPGDLRSKVQDAATERLSTLGLPGASLRTSVKTEEGAR